MPLLMETAAPEREWCRKTAAKPGRELTTDLGQTQECTGSATWATTGQAAWLLPHEVSEARRKLAKLSLYLVYMALYDPNK